ncbi:MAG: hypothetical protein HQL29_01230 [Candidatus Omnitrophica bacterium]|nr:hypothetical protein [Candidatus Omnitrophota bacterium]
MCSNGKMLPMSFISTLNKSIKFVLVMALLFTGVPLDNAKALSPIPLTGTINGEYSRNDIEIFLKLLLAEISVKQKDLLSLDFDDFRKRNFADAGRRAIIEPETFERIEENGKVKYTMKYSLTGKTFDVVVLVDNNGETDISVRDVISVSHENIRYFPISTERLPFWRHSLDLAYEFNPSFTQERSSLNRIYAELLPGVKEWIYHKFKNQISGSDLLLDNYVNEFLGEASDDFKWSYIENHGSLMSVFEKLEKIVTAEESVDIAAVLSVLGAISQKQKKWSQYKMGVFYFGAAYLFDKNFRYLNAKAWNLKKLGYADEAREIIQKLKKQYPEMPVFSAETLEMNTVDISNIVRKIRETENITSIDKAEFDTYQTDIRVLHQENITLFEPFNYDPRLFSGLSRSLMFLSELSVFKNEFYHLNGMNAKGDVLEVFDKLAESYKYAHEAVKISNLSAKEKLPHALGVFATNSNHGGRMLEEWNKNSIFRSITVLENKKRIEACLTRACEAFDDFSKILEQESKNNPAVKNEMKEQPNRKIISQADEIISGISIMEKVKDAVLERIRLVAEEDMKDPDAFLAKVKTSVINDDTIFEGTIGESVKKAAPELIDSIFRKIGADKKMVVVMRVTNSLNKEDRTIKEIIENLPMYDVYLGGNEYENTTYIKGVLKRLEYSDYVAGKKEVYVEPKPNNRDGSSKKVNVTDKDVRLMKQGVEGKGNFVEQIEELENQYDAIRSWKGNILGREGYFEYAEELLQKEKKNVLIYSDKVNKYAAKKPKEQNADEGRNLTAEFYTRKHAIEDLRKNIIKNRTDFVKETISVTCIKNKEILAEYTRLYGELGVDAVDNKLSLCGDALSVFYDENGSIMIMSFENFAERRDAVEKSIEELASFDIYYKTYADLSAVLRGYEESVNILSSLIDLPEINIIAQDHIDKAHEDICNNAVRGISFDESAEALQSLKDILLSRKKYADDICEFFNKICSGENVEAIFKGVAIGNNKNKIKTKREAVKNMSAKAIRILFSGYVLGVGNKESVRLLEYICGIDPEKIKEEVVEKVKSRAKDKLEAYFLLNDPGFVKNIDALVAFVKKGEELNPGIFSEKMKREISALVGNRKRMNDRLKEENILDLSKDSRKSLREKKQQIENLFSESTIFIEDADKKMKHVFMDKIQREIDQLTWILIAWISKWGSGSGILDMDGNQFRDILEYKEAYVKLVDKIKTSNQDGKRLFIEQVKASLDEEVEKMRQDVREKEKSLLINQGMISRINKRNKSNSRIADELRDIEEVVDKKAEEVKRKKEKLAKIEKNIKNIETLASGDPESSYLKAIEMIITDLIKELADVDEAYSDENKNFFMSTVPILYTLLSKEGSPLIQIWVNRNEKGEPVSVEEMMINNGKKINDFVNIVVGKNSDTSDSDLNLSYEEGKKLLADMIADERAMVQEKEVWMPVKLFLETVMRALKKYQGSLSALRDGKYSELEYLDIVQLMFSSADFEENGKSGEYIKFLDALINGVEDTRRDEVRKIRRRYIASLPSGWMSPEIREKYLSGVVALANEVTSRGYDYNSVAEKVFGEKPDDKERKILKLNSEYGGIKLNSSGMKEDLDELIAMDKKKAGKKAEEFSKKLTKAFNEMKLAFTHGSFSIASVLGEEKTVYDHLINALAKFDTIEILVAKDLKTNAVCIRDGKIVFDEDFVEAILTMGKGNRAADIILAERLFHELGLLVFGFNSDSKEAIFIDEIEQIQRDVILHKAIFDRENAANEQVDIFIHKEVPGSGKKFSELFRSIDLFKNINTWSKEINQWPDKTRDSIEKYVRKNIPELIEDFRDKNIRFFVADEKTKKSEIVLKPHLIERWDEMMKVINFSKGERKEGVPGKLFDMVVKVDRGPDRDTIGTILLKELRKNREGLIVSINDYLVFEELVAMLCIHANNYYGEDVEDTERQYKILEDVNLAIENKDYVIGVNGEIWIDDILANNFGVQTASTPVEEFSNPEHITRGIMDLIIGKNESSLRDVYFGRSLEHEVPKKIRMELAKISDEDSLGYVCNKILPSLKINRERLVDDLDDLEDIEKLFQFLYSQADKYYQKHKNDVGFLKHGYEDKFEDMKKTHARRVRELKKIFEDAIGLHNEYVGKKWDKKYYRKREMIIVSFCISKG